jgi:hypothetical protein
MDVALLENLTLRLEDVWVNLGYHLTQLTPESIYKIPNNDLGINWSRYYSCLHLKWMLVEMETFDDFAKFHRWAGFIQGTLWGLSEVTLKELRSDVVRAREGLVGIVPRSQY